MNFNLIFGIAFVVLGFIGLFGYITKNEKIFSKTKKEKINKVYGEKFGTLFHIIRYVIGPIFLGVIIILREL